MAERSPRDPRDPLDEEAAWAEIVAGYGEQPAFPTGDGPPAAPAEDGDGDSKGETPAKDEADASQDEADAKDGAAAGGTGTGSGDPLTGGGSRPGSFVVYAPGVGPRDWSAAKASDDDFDDSDEGHFTPPEPPPLPQADVTAKFAWIAVIGGPLLLVAMVLLQQPVTWWITVLGIGGFLGGFATLVARMKSDDEDDDDLPGSGAVV
ncbi:hypothetical protein HXP44_29970 [Streptomyces sioyaensis]|uniref:DUF308 domain-containing protein n=1 Tax=Streptomyces sioyaensis TaxID=67364 RepID=A0A4Q1R167_9ACTN|nr:hypothetical protein [Streptomyces sioyaensis]MBM4796147.1 hypothetical protein [Streptomyces sioyaensis]RXS64353.1 hypothetical protein EST54_22500 [Streptomyces sioyaensis]